MLPLPNVPSRFDPDPFIPDQVPDDMQPKWYTVMFDSMGQEFAGEAEVVFLCIRSTTNIVLHVGYDLQLSDIAVRVSLGFL